MKDWLLETLWENVKLKEHVQLRMEQGRLEPSGAQALIDSFLMTIARIRRVLAKRYGILIPVSQC